MFYIIVFKINVALIILQNKFFKAFAFRNKSIIHLIPYYDVRATVPTLGLIKIRKTSFSK